MKNKKIYILLIILFFISIFSLKSYADDKNNLIITMEYKIDNNMVTAIIHSNNPLANTKSTWELSSDKYTYSKVFSQNQTYTTPVQDIYGNVVNAEININNIEKTKISFEPQFNDNGTIKGIIKSNTKLKDTKSTWNLSEDKLTYTKTLDSKTTPYTTPVETINGEVIYVKIEVNKPKLNLTVDCVYNNNTATVTIQSNIKLKDTKSTWKLSSDALKYTKVIDANQIYTTPVQDIYGTTEDVRIEVTKLTPQIKVDYKYNTNSDMVTVILKSNSQLEHTKPTWNLSGDKYTYSKNFDKNQKYTTPVQDVYGNMVNVEISITQIPPKIEVSYSKNSNGTVTVTMTSNQELAHTKPSWTLSDNKLKYTKTFDSDQNYTTPIQDIYGNIVNVKISLKVKGEINIDTSKYPGYKEKIQQLMNVHPNWNFEILYTGLTFDEVIRGECSLHSRNLVPTNYGGEWVCSVCGTKLYDSGWYCASEKAVAYYMDPRNFLDDNNVFQFLDLNEYSSDSVSLDGIQSKVSGTFLQNYSNDINNACKNTNVNPYYIIARLIQEQGSKGTTIGTGMDGGDGKTYFNPFNIGASGNGYDAIYSNALATAKSYGWDSMQKAIEGGIGFCKKNWLENYQNTLYQNKFDIDTTNGSSLYSHQYMQNLMAAYSEAKTLRSMYANTGKVNSSFTFVIPVYENMNSSNYAMPSNNIETSAMNFKVTADGGLNLRSEASTNSSVIKLVPNGEIVLSLQRGVNSNWQKVMLNDGTIGYMSGTYLQQVADVTNCSYAAYVKTADGSGCYIRVGPSTKTDRITALADGTWLTVINEGTYNNIDGYNWVRILLPDGRQAFMPSKYLSR